MRVTGAASLFTFGCDGGCFLSQFIYDCCYLMKLRVKLSGGSFWSTVRLDIRRGSERDS